MLNRLTSIIAFVFVALAVTPAWADEYSDTIAIFNERWRSAILFRPVRQVARAHRAATRFAASPSWRQSTKGFRGIDCLLPIEALL